MTSALRQTVVEQCAAACRESHTAVRGALLDFSWDQEGVRLLRVERDDDDTWPVVRTLDAGCPSPGPGRIAQFECSA
jgi:hypothetical protein